ncbi:hypothetical protein MLD38_039215 [Melastoma candidum]|uniref:Uncharacterized protein n=1 Tax=Melastoma candidum TaxID=119954 RepID=A0ACB9L2W6_9MYRT|nr:hypothetical protein MLD38_039215 [Melastoma candidum]
MGNPVEDCFALALASRLWTLSFSYHDLLVFLALLGFARLALALLQWSRPGGPAWGRYYLNCLGRSGPIPGPRGLPFLGSMGIMASPLAHRELAACAESFCARRLMAFSLGENRVVITSDPDVAREILNGPNFANRPVKESARGLMFDRAMGFAPFGSYWRNLRKIAAAHLLCSKQVAATEAQRGEIVDQMSSIIYSSVADGSPFVTIRDMLRRASLCNMMSSVFGRRYKLGLGDDDDQEMRELLSMVDAGYDLLGKFNWSDHLPWIAGLDVQGVRLGCNELVSQVRGFLNQIITEHRETAKDRKTGEGDKNMDFVDVLMSLEGKDKLEEDDMIAVLWEMIFRGTDTVAVLIEWVIARMVIHQDIQLKVQDELDRVVGRSRPLLESDLQSTPYLTSVVKEVLRLHPPGPLLSWARLATEDTKVAGHDVPRGSIAMVNMWAIMRDPDQWPDPLEFRPERFATRGGDADSWLSGSDLRWAPFGSGRRVCPGKSMGLTAACHWVGRLLQEFEWAAEEDHPVNLREVLKLSCELANPVHAKVRLRRR